MGIIDIVCIAVIVLFGLIGLVKGFSKGSIRSLASLCGTAVAYFAGVPATFGMMKTGLGTSLNNFYVGKLPSTATFTQALASATLNPDMSAGDIATANSGYLASGLSEVHIVKIFQGLFITHVQDFSSDVQHALASSFGYWTMLAAVIVILFLLVFFLAYFLLKKAGDVAFGEDGKSGLGRIAGLIKGLLQAALYLIVAMIIIVFVNQLMVKGGNNALATWLTNDLKLSDSNMSIGKLLYNTAGSLLNWISTVGK